MARTTHSPLFRTGAVAIAVETHVCVSLSLSLFLNFDARRTGFLILMREGREFFLFCLQK